MFLLVKKRILLIGETGLGTTYYSKRVFDGIAVTLGKKNGNGGLESIIFNGPVIPRIPRKWGKRHEQHLAVLADREDGEKIGSFKDGTDYTRSELELFLETFEDVPKFYVLSDTDQGNINDLKSDLLDERKTQEKEVIERLETKISDLSGDISSGYDHVAELRDYHQILLKASIEDKLTNEDKSQIMKVVVDMLGEKRIRDTLKLDDVAELETKHLPKLMEAITSANEERDLELREVELNLGARKQAMQSYLAKFHPVVDSKLMDELATQAYLEYTEKVVYKVFDRKNVTILGGRGDDVYIGGFHFRIAHNENMRSKTPLVTDIKKRVESDKARHVQGIGETPTISISTHHAGGWRVYRQRKDRTGSETVDYLHGPTLHDQQLLEEAKQKGMKNVDLVRWDQASRYGFSSGVVLVELDTESGERSYEFMGLSYLQELGDLNGGLEGLVKERQTVYSRISKGRKKGESIADLESARDRLTAGIVTKRKDIDKAAEKGYHLIKIRGDGHIGSASSLDEISSRVLVRAATNFTKKVVEEEGIPLDIILDGGDEFHGVTVDGQGKVEDYSGLTKADKELYIRRQAENVLKASTPNRKDDELKKLLELYSRIEESTPLLTLRDQMSIIEGEFLDIVRFTLERGGYYGTTSGGHFNDMVNGHFDEADLLRLLLPREYRNQIFVFSGVRQGSGRYIVPKDIVPKKLQELVGGVDISGRDLGADFDIYMSHAVRAGPDEVMAGMKNVIQVNWANDPDIKTALAAVFHRHHGGAGGTGGCGKSKIVISGFGMQPTIPYVHEIGKQSSVRGIILAYMNPNKEVYKIRMIDEEVLERTGHISSEAPYWGTLPTLTP